MRNAAPSHKRARAKHRIAGSGETSNTSPASLVSNGTCLSVGVTGRLGAVYINVAHAQGVRQGSEADSLPNSEMRRERLYTIAAAIGCLVVGNWT